MGDSFEVVVDVEATPDQAPRLGGTVISWLTVEGVIDASPVADRAGSAELYLPGPNHRLTAADNTPASPAPQLGRLEVTTDRRVFYPVQGQPGPAVCPLCGYSVALTDPETGQPTEHRRLFDNALADWYAGGPGSVFCPNNGSAIAINAWQWQGDWPIAVGHLGFTFWNWPPLHADFVGRIGERLGHRVVTTRGKL